MNPRPWLNYTGQPLDALIAAERTHRIDSIIVAIDQAIGHKWARVEWDGLTAEEQIVVVIERFESEINNGGFALFFENTPEFVGAIVTALHRIGCAQTAEIADRAIRLLKVTDMSPASVSRASIKCGHREREQLNELTDRFLQGTEDIAQSLFNFIKTNQQHFQA